MKPCLYILTFMCPFILASKTKQDGFAERSTLSPTETPYRIVKLHTPADSQIYFHTVPPGSTNSPVMTAPAIRSNGIYHGNSETSKTHESIGTRDLSLEAKESIGIAAGVVGLLAFIFSAFGCL
ncbi:uncharacterized protein LY89DRAFT_742754 [Mollisia scopiformis]|uniref:Uncharacterized protein n=1 Tax=Mollisia scopiformis TaxID=149040 RepID=A0A132B6L3_MOLSC|nr:uncharacterized protein LY89DRAFT_742754 [Mollisia scopiformis]KUJ07524.1 hypothetical protein LY89DRAFT_742754 [Mollisia scopiformis]